MPWAPQPESRQAGHRQAWFPQPPVVERRHRAGWFPRWRRTASDTGVGEDGALIVPGIAAATTGLGVGAGVVPRIDTVAGDSGVGVGAAAVDLAAAVWDGGIGTDLAATIGVQPTVDGGVGDDHTSLLPRVAGPMTGVGDDRVAALARVTAAESGVGQEAGSADFTPHEPVEVSYTTPGTYTYVIPVWCRYLDIAAVGSGRGGNGNTSAIAGAGGAGGQWDWTTITRGVSLFTWATRELTVVVPEGGLGGNGNLIGVGAPGYPGSPARVVLPVYEIDIISAPGGTQERSGNQSGGSPGNLTVPGWRTFVGGAESTSGNGTPGNPPGGGGRGGNGSYFSINRGGQGAAGAVYIRARQ